MEGTEGRTDVSSLPEGVIANILSLTTPLDACRSSAVSWVFHAAAQSDIVWDRFLPNDLDDLISRSKPGGLNFDPITSSKKEIFFSLCNSPLLIDNAKKSLSLDKQSGKKCLMLGARDLSIVWDDTSVYWTWESHPESRFGEVVVIFKAWWLEIRGKISSRLLSPTTTYAAYIVFKMRERRYFGFNIDFVDAMVGIVGSEHSVKTVCLDPYLDDPLQRRRHVPQAGSNLTTNNMSRLEEPRGRDDDWFETELGEFDNKGGDDEVEIILKDLKCTDSKNSLVVQGIEIRPKINPD
ncbi:F-box protein PP2-B10-like isoform X1 [Cucumis melo var. makuwa]|uniref:F-box protein PP2-B10-like isoform X1 n=2 Tax=Cucumis melo TaxID=3656 RepID=A0A1S4DZG4_CUCME|nr:F-box protein PP2-B10-like [Cucumis melo]KAA0058305.1 F-box protein PP2-B10-like isoform X1 [Cucumis melo var. makuwa]